MEGLQYNYSNRSLINVTLMENEPSELNHTFSNNSLGEVGVARESPYKHVVDLLSGRIVPAICIMGILGNIFTLIVFCYKAPNQTGQKTSVIERSATAGLITLAASDLLFCLAGFPALFLSQPHQSGTLIMISSYYQNHKNALLNIFLFTSTWLITLISAERCLAVCYPHLARNWITVRRTVAVHSVVFIVSLGLYIPTFFAYTLMKYPCTPTQECYYQVPGWFFYQQTNAHAHFVLVSTLGTFLPMLMLIGCNAAILQSIYRRRHLGSNNPERHQMMLRTTWVLIAIVFCFIICVCPSIFLQFFFRVGVASNIEHYVITNAVTNLLQAVKFSANFLLYCILHKKFRDTISAMRCFKRNTEMTPCPEPV